MRTITITDDRQLWRIVQPIDGKDCSWPMYVTPATEYEGRQCYLVESAVPVENRVQWDFVAHYIQQHAFDSDGNRWLVRPTILEGLLKKCSGVTPAYYKVWPSGSIRQDSAVDSMPDSADSLPDSEESGSEDFIRYVCNNYGLTNVEAVRNIFTALCLNSVPWMIEHRKPIRFGLFTLYALPLRANWKAIQAAKWPEVLSVFRKGKRSRNATLEASGFLKSLHDTNLVSMTSANAFGWSLEVVAEKQFDRAAQRAEENIAASSQPFKYVTRWSRLVSEKSYEKILEIFGSWLEKAALPCATVDTSIARSRWSLRPKTPRGRVRPVAATPTHVVVSTEPTGKNEPQCEGAVDETETPGVPQVPAV